MMLSDKAIQEFRDKKEFGVELTWEDATDKAHALIGLYKAVLGPED